MMFFADLVGARIGYGAIDLVERVLTMHKKAAEKSTVHVVKTGTHGSTANPPVIK